MPGRRTRHLSARQLRECVAAGWEIGLHGSRHCDLTRLSESHLETEIQQARTGLQQTLGHPIRFFSYPYGRDSDQVVHKIQTAGLSAAFVLADADSASNGDDLFHLVRRPVYCIDSAVDVLAKVGDPHGRTPFGRWQLKKELAAHEVGKWFAGKWG